MPTGTPNSADRMNFLIILFASGASSPLNTLPLIVRMAISFGVNIAGGSGI
jgi:ABC-type uncharacterized transport system permease subunit